MVKSRSPLPPDQMTAREFFAFDLKDTFRLIVWIIVCAFTLGGLYYKREADMVTIEGKRVALEARMDREFILVSKNIDRLDLLLTANQANQTVILASIETVKTELRYVNEKIDVLRNEIRNKN